MGKSPDLLDLIFNKKDVYVEDDEIDRYILPYDYVPDTVESASSFIGIEVDVPRIVNSTIKDVYVTAYIIVHKSLMNVDFRSGVRTDLLVFEVDKIMNGNDDFGVGRCELHSIERFKPHQDFYGRVLVYKIKEFNKKHGGY